MRHHITPVLWPTGSRFLWVGVRTANNKGSKAWMGPTSICQMVTRLQENTKERIRQNVSDPNPKLIGADVSITSGGVRQQCFLRGGVGVGQLRVWFGSAAATAAPPSLHGWLSGHGNYPNPTPTTLIVERIQYCESLLHESPLHAGSQNVCPMSSIFMSGLQIIIYLKFLCFKLPK